MRQLLVATTSKGKIAELEQLLRGVPFKIVGISDIASLKNFNVEEPAATFEGNALIKAIIYGKKTGSLTLADDSGLEVDALNGRPGVLSARYAPGSDKDRYEKLLWELKEIKDNDRSAFFKSVIAIYDPINDKVRTCEGVYKGEIAREPKGTNGFGYDPVFFNSKLGKTNAEMTLEEKNSVSHRGQALQKAKKILQEEFLGKV